MFSFKSIFTVVFCSSVLLPFASCAPQAATSAAFSPWAGCPSPSPTPSNTGKMSTQCNGLGPAPAAPRPQTSDTIETVALWYANMYRCNHTDTNLLVWNSTLAKWAQECGDKCSGHCMGNNAPGVLPDGFIVPYEQIEFSGPADNNMADAMETWYYGVGSDSFEGEFNPDGSTTGNDSHGSRVIWRASTQMGCAVSHCPDFSVTCHFGNGDSWNQVSKPGSCNPTETDVKVNLGKPLGHERPPTSNNAFSQGYTIPGTSPDSATSSAGQASSATATPSGMTTLSSSVATVSAASSSVVQQPSTATDENAPTATAGVDEQDDCERE